MRGRHVADRRAQPRLAGRRADGHPRRPLAGCRSRSRSPSRWRRHGRRQRGRRCRSGRDGPSWELGVPRRDLHALAAQLGSDVPFALHGGTALGTGRGEELATVLARTTFHWVLRSRPAACPPGRCSPRSTGSRNAGHPLDWTTPAGCCRAGGRRCGRAGAPSRQRAAGRRDQPRPGSAPHLARGHRGGRACGHRLRLRSDLRLPVSTAASAVDVGTQLAGAGSAGRYGWPAVLSRVRG